MKRIIAAALMIMLCAVPALAETPEIIACTCYRQIGWGDRFQMGCIDNEGNLYAAQLESGGLDLPYPDSEACAYLFEKGMFENVGKYTGDLAALKSLSATIEDRQPQYQSAACDAGTEESYAVRDGLWISVGASGDSVYENPDPTAQAVYKILGKTFRGYVTSYYGEENMAPAGFVPVKLLDFIGCPDADIEGATVTAVIEECEAGIQPYPLTEAQIERAKAIARGTVTGKHSNIYTCGNTVIYTFADDEGNTVATFDIFDGLLSTNDGMYEIEY